MSRYRPTDTPGLVKDVDSGALLFTDVGRIREHRARRARNAEIERNAQRLDQLEASVTEIHAILREIMTTLRRND